MSSNQRTKNNRSKRAAGPGAAAPPRAVHRDRDRLIHFTVDTVMGKTGLGLGRADNGPSDLDACIVTAWILSGGRSFAESVRGLERRHDLKAFARQLSAVLEPQIEQAADRELLIRQLVGADPLTVRAAYQRVQASQPWRASMREDVRRADRTRASRSSHPSDTDEG